MTKIEKDVLEWLECDPATKRYMEKGAPKIIGVKDLFGNPVTPLPLSNKLK